MPVLYTYYNNIRYFSIFYHVDFIIIFSSILYLYRYCNAARFSCLYTQDCDNGCANSTSDFLLLSTENSMKAANEYYSITAAPLCIATTIQSNDERLRKVFT